MICYQNNMEECIKDLLKRFQLEQYADMFLSNGYDDVAVIRGINEMDLQTMGLTCHKEIYDILYLLNQLNEAFAMYMSVHEVYSRPSTEDVLSYIAEKFEQKGIFPSGEECVPVVLEKLENESIILPAYHNVYINKDGTASTRREYKMLIARYAQELFLPDQSVAGAMKLIHDTAVEGLPPPKPPKPKVIPVFDQTSGKLVWVNSQDDPNYENINYIYEFLNNVRPGSPMGNTDTLDFTIPYSGVPPPNNGALPPHSGASTPKVGTPLHPRHADDLRRYEEVRKVESPQSQKSSPGPTRPVKKKQTFFKRFKHNLFGKSNSSLDSFLASSTNRSSECSNSKLSFFKNKSKKDKTRFERQRSNSAPEPGRNVGLHQIPEHRNTNQYPGNANHYPGSTNQYPSNTNQYPGSTNQYPGSTNQCPGNNNPTYHISNPTYARPYVNERRVGFPGLPREQDRSRPDQTFRPGSQPGGRGDTFSNNNSMSSSGSLSGDSAYSSRPSLTAIRSTQRAVLYTALPIPHSNQVPLSRRHCSCLTCLQNVQ